MITIFVLAFAVAFSLALIEKLIRIAFAVSLTFLIGFIIAYIILSKKKFFRKFTSGWQKYGAILLQIIMIGEIVINAMTLIISFFCMILFQPQHF